MTRSTMKNDEAYRYFVNGIFYVCNLSVQQKKQLSFRSTISHTISLYKVLYQVT